METSEAWVRAKVSACISTPFRECISCVLMTLFTRYPCFWIMNSTYMRNCFPNFWAAFQWGYYKRRIWLGHVCCFVEMIQSAISARICSLVSMVLPCQRIRISSIHCWYQIVLVRSILSIVHVFIKVLVLDEAEMVMRPNLNVHLDLIPTNMKTACFCSVFFILPVLRWTERLLT